MGCYAANIAQKPRPDYSWRPFWQPDPALRAMPYLISLMLIAFVGLMVVGCWPL
jgi:hypothetical protein